MISQILHRLDYATELLQYFTGSVTTTTATRKYAATGIETGFSVGDKIVIAGCAQSASNGTFTIETVATNYITVVESIGTGEGPTASVTVNQEVQGTWQNVERWAKLTGVINCSGNAIVYVDQSGDAGSNTDYTSSWAVTGGTALAFEVDVLLKHARLRIRTNAADQTTMRGYLYGRAVS